MVSRRAYHRWDARELLQLQTMHQNNASYAAIARKLGRSSRAVELASRQLLACQVAQHGLKNVAAAYKYNADDVVFALAPVAYQQPLMDRRTPDWMLLFFAFYAVVVLMSCIATDSNV